MSTQAQSDLKAKTMNTTLETISRAFIKAANEGKNYDVIFRMAHSLKAGGGADYMVSHKTQYKTRTYFVSVYTVGEKTTCTCPEHARSGFCKHAAMGIEDLQIRQGEEAREDAEIARLETLAGKF